MAGIAARNDKKTRITPRHIQLAIRFDKELYQFLRNLTIPNGGVIQKIHKILLPNNKSNTSKVVVAAKEEEVMTEYFITSITVFAFINFLYCVLYSFRNF